MTRPSIKVWAATSLCIAGLSFIAAKYFSGQRFGGTAGETSGDLSPHDAGRFAGPEFVEARRSSVRNYRAYTSLVLRPMGASGLDAADRTLLEGALRRELASGKVAVNIADLRTLADELAIVLLAASAVDTTGAALGDDIVMPESLDHLGAALEEVGLGTLDPKRVKDPAYAAELRAKLLALRLNGPRADDVWVAWSADPKGFRATATIRGLDDVAALPLPTHAGESEADLAYWLGSLAQGGIVFRRHGTPPVRATDVGSPGFRVVLVQVIVIVQTRGGDRYPAHMVFYKDRSAPGGTRNWHLRQWSKRSSIKSANAPVLVF